MAAISMLHCLKTFRNVPALRCLKALPWNVTEQKAINLRCFSTILSSGQLTHTLQGRTPIQRNLALFPGIVLKDNGFITRLCLHQQSMSFKSGSRSKPVVLSKIYPTDRPSSKEQRYGFIAVAAFGALTFLFVLLLWGEKPFLCHCHHLAVVLLFC